MKIAYLITRSDTIGGAQVHLVDLAQAGARDGHDVTVLLGGDGPFASLVRDRGIKCICLKYLKRPISIYHDTKAFFELKNILKTLSPDLLHAHSTKAGLLGRAAAKSLRIPVIFTAHGWSFTDGVSKRSGFIATHLERAATLITDRVITVSEYDRNLAIKKRIGTPSSFVAIHNGMPDIANRYRASPKKEPVRIVMVARFDAQKDQNTLINALHKHRDKDWMLDFIGDGPLESTAKQKAIELGLEKRIFFLGLRNDVPEKLANSQLFVLASNWEGLPLSIIEAMRSGLPVIASDVGGCSEAVDHETTGYLVERGNINDLTKKLELLLSSPERRASFGKAGRAKYEAEFTFDQMYKRTAEVYQTVLKKKSDQGATA